MDQWKVIWPGALVVGLVFVVLIGIMAGFIDPKLLMFWLRLESLALFSLRRPVRFLNCFSFKSELVSTLPCKTIKRFIPLLHWALRPLGGLQREIAYVYEQLIAFNGISWMIKALVEGSLDRSLVISVAIGWADPCCDHSFCDKCDFLKHENHELS